MKPESYEDTEPGNCANLVLAVVRIPVVDVGLFQICRLVFVVVILSLAYSSQLPDVSIMKNDF
jgi:hypothetical protein